MALNVDAKPICKTCAWVSRGSTRPTGGMRASSAAHATLSSVLANCAGRLRGRWICLASPKVLHYTALALFSI